MKRLVLKKWVEVMFSIIALIGILVIWFSGDVAISLIAAIFSISALSVVLIYGRD